MKTWMTCVVLAFGGTALADTAKAKFELKGDAAKGAEVFKTFCASCHGDKGAGDGVAGQALNPKPQNFADPKRAAEIDDEYVYKVVGEGGQAVGKSPLMVAWKGSLTDQQVRDVAAHVRAIQKSALPPAKGKAAKK